MTELVATYESAVAAATSKPFAVPNEPSVRRTLATAANTHCRGDGTIRGSLAAVREAVSEWVEGHKNSPNLTAGWAPRKFLDWLNGGRDGPTQKPPEPVRRLRYLTGDEP